MTLDPDFTATPLLDVRYLRNGTRDTVTIEYY